MKFLKCISRDNGKVKKKNCDHTIVNCAWEVGWWTYLSYEREQSKESSADVCELFYDI